MTTKLFYSSCVLLALTGCATVPTSPSVMVLPGQGRSFEQFQRDNALCQQYASQQVGGQTVNESGIDSGVISAAVGTGLGAAAGAALGGSSGAAVGAGIGLITGSAVGTSTANTAMTATQDHYDIAYVQCMYAKGHQVPVYGQFANIKSAQPAAPAANIPPPPAGSPPPPPPK